MTTKIHPNTGEPSNEQRAEWAEHAMDAFGRKVFGGRSFHELEEDQEDAIADLICDLLHLCVATGIDPDDVTRRGIRNFADEVAMEMEGQTN